MGLPNRVYLPSHTTLIHTVFRPAFSKEVPVEFDLGHLLVSDSNPLDAQAFRNEKEAYLLSNTSDDIQLLVNSIFELPTKTDDDGVMAQLPEPLFDLPREKPVCFLPYDILNFLKLLADADGRDPQLPAPKVLTKWQKFANAKGIAPKPKRDRMVFDEEKGEWVPRWGYKGKNKELDDQWLVEVPLGKGEEDNSGHSVHPFYSGTDSTMCRRGL